MERLYRKPGANKPVFGVIDIDFFEEKGVYCAVFTLAVPGRCHMRKGGFHDRLKKTKDMVVADRVLGSHFFFRSLR